MHEMQSEIKYVNKKQHFDLESSLHDESLSLHIAESEPGSSTWTYTQLPWKQQVVCMPGKSHFRLKTILSCLKQI